MEKMTDKEKEELYKELESIINQGCNIDDDGDLEIDLAIYSIIHFIETNFIHNEQK